MHERTLRERERSDGTGAAISESPISIVED